MPVTAKIDGTSMDGNGTGLQLNGGYGMDVWVRASVHTSDWLQFTFKLSLHLGICVYVCVCVCVCVC